MTAYAHNSLARSVTQTPFETVGTASTANKFVLSRPGLSHGILKPKTIVYWAFHILTVTSIDTGGSNREDYRGHSTSQPKPH